MSQFVAFSQAQGSGEEDGAKGSSQHSETDREAISLENLEQLVNEELMPLPDVFLPGCDRTKGKVKERLSYYMPKFACCALPFLQEVFESKSGGRSKKYINIPLHVQKYVRQKFIAKNEQIKELERQLCEVKRSYLKQRSSRFRGVNRNGSGWAASLQNKRYAGSFKTEISAAVAHDKGLLKTQNLNALKHLNFRKCQEAEDLIKEKKGTREWEEFVARGKTIYRGVTLDKMKRKITTDGEHFKTRRKYWWNKLANETQKKWPDRQQMYVAEYGTIQTGTTNDRPRVRCTLGKYHTPEEAAYAVNEIAWMTGEYAKDNPTVTWEHVQAIRQKREDECSIHLRTWLQDVVMERERHNARKVQTKKNNVEEERSVSDSSSMPQRPTYTFKEFEAMGPYSKFKAQYIDENWPNVHKLTQKERINLVREAWKRKNHGLPAYDVFCMEYEEERPKLFEGKTAMEKIEILRDAYLTKFPQKKNVLKKCNFTANYVGGDYSKFKLNYMKEHYEKMHALDKVERNRILKAAYEKQRKKNARKRPYNGYNSFRVKWEKDNEKELEGMPEALKVQKVKEAYKIFKESKKLKASSYETPYMKFRNRWINENNTEGKHPKEITAAIKSAWREEKQEDKRTPYQKFRETTLKEKEAEWKDLSNQQITQRLRAAWEEKIEEANAERPAGATKSSKRGYSETVEVPPTKKRRVSL